MPPRTTPSFRGLAPTNVTASRVGRGNRKTGTQPELLLRRALWGRGLRYRLHDGGLPGRPDIVFPSAHIVVFCDGDFWHGRDWPERRRRLEAGSNAAYWVAKIERNRARDAETDLRLKQLGWQVIRVWESDIRRDAPRLALQVEEEVRANRSRREAERRVR